MRILVIGAGAVGGYFGGRLSAAGRDVTFLLRGARAEQIRRRGLDIVSPFGEFHVQPKVLTAAELAASREHFDLILVSTKSYSLEDAMEDFAPAVGPGTVILPLLNGMRHLDQLVERFGEGPVLGGSTQIVSDVDADGRIVLMEPRHDLVFGERDCTRSARFEAIAAEVHDVGIDDKPSDNVLAFMWQKWVFLASLGAITCLLRGAIGDVVASPGGPETAAAILAECDAIATANGYPTAPKFLDVAAGRLLAAGSPLTASMYRDLTRGRAVEADSILGDMLRRGRERGVAAPLLQAAYVQLSIYSRKRGTN